MIARVRIGFVVLGAALLVLLGLLLARALQSLEQERERRHAAVAARVFDEAERALSEFLSEEEERPPDDYFGEERTGRPSPLAGPPARAFVVGYFQLDAQGALSTPERGASAAIVGRLSNISGLLRDEVKRADLERASEVRRALGQVPGTTRAVQNLALLTGAEKPVADEPLADLRKEEAEADAASSYAALDKLNLASKVRQERYASSADDVFAEEELAEAQAPAMATARPAAPPERSGLATEPQRPAELLRRMSRSPLAAETLDATSLVVHRTVVLPDGPYRQGIVVDVGRLTRWLEERVLGESGLSGLIDLEFEHGGAAPAFGPPPADRFVYQHRFGEPFQSLVARASLAPLPDEGGARYVYALGALLVLASTAGLWAVYRRVATAMHFAERRSNFAAAVSHELKTPLTAIRMYAEMLRDGMVPDEAKRREYYDTITGESERLTRLINNVLEFSRLENGTANTELVSGAIEDVLRHAVRLLEPHARSQGFELVLHVDDGLPPVTHDPDAIEQLLFNLVDNALKYARDAERKQIVLSASAHDGGVALRIRDYGPGVAREHLRHLFEAFYRAEDELTRRTKGTGIGLALARGLAERMGARIAAYNHLEGGLEVQLLLRCAS